MLFLVAVAIVLAVSVLKCSQITYFLKEVDQFNGRLIDALFK